MGREGNELWEKLITRERLVKSRPYMKEQPEVCEAAGGKSVSFP